MAKYGRNAGCSSKILQYVTQVRAQQVCTVPQTLPAVASDSFQVINLLDLGTKHILPLSLSFFCCYLLLRCEMPHSLAGL